MHASALRSIRRRSQARRALMLLLVASLLLLIPGCGAIDRLRGTIEETTDKTVAVLDEAIVTLADDSADWQIVLQDTIAQLTEESQQLVRNDLTNLLRRAPATAGAEFRCNVDFLRTRVRQDLIRIRASLLGVEVEAQEPTLCAVVPLAVDASLVPATLNLVEFYGYDFDTTPVQVLLRDGTQERDVSQFLDRPTHYHMTLNLGSNGVVLSPGSQKLILKWQEREISTIAVIQPATPACQTRVVDFKPSPLSFLPPHTRGDRDFSGNGPTVMASVRLINQRTHIDAVVEMTARETKSDWTTASGSRSFPLYTPDPGWRVQQIVGETESTFSYRDDDHQEDLFAGNGPVFEYTFMGDGEDSDAGIHTGLKLNFNELRLELVEEGNCVSTLAIKVLETQHLVSPGILGRFGPQLGEVEIQPDTLRDLRPQIQDFDLFTP